MALHTIDGRETRWARCRWPKAATMTGLLMRRLQRETRRAQASVRPMNFRMIEVSEGRVMLRGHAPRRCHEPHRHGPWRMGGDHPRFAHWPAQSTRFAHRLRLDVDRPEGQFRTRHPADDRTPVRDRRGGASGSADCHIRARLVDENGKLYAHGSQACSVFKLPTGLRLPRHLDSRFTIGQ